MNTVLVDLCASKPYLSTLSADAAGKLDVLWHDGHTLDGVNGAQVGVLEQTHQVGLGRLLQGQDGGALEAQGSLEFLRNLTHKALEWQLADEELGGLHACAYSIIHFQPEHGMMVCDPDELMVM